MVSKEVWQDIAGWKNFYQVSSLGNVRSMDRTVLGKDGIKQIRKGQLLHKTFNAYTGYESVHLRKPGYSKRVLIHRIVAETFIPNPNGKKEVNHISGLKTDNRVENLEWATRQENVGHSMQKLHTDPAKGKRKPVVCVETGEVFQSVTQAAREKGADISRICLVCEQKKGSKGEKATTSGGFHWKWFLTNMEEQNEPRKRQKKNTTL